MMEELLNDVKQNLKIEIKSIKHYTDGTTESLVFSINEKYLIKKIDPQDYFNQIIFFEYYSKSSSFSKLIYGNHRLSYICFEFIKGEKLWKEKMLDPTLIISNIYSITKEYLPYDSTFYGYLNYPNKTPYEFLKSEIEYAKEKIKEIDSSKVYEALETLKNYEIPKYLLHGDFGVHNFLLEQNRLRVIDPMPLVFDPLYDFYFAVLSSSFLLLDTKYLLSFYDRPMKYKKNLFLIVFYIRMSRAFMYDKDHFKEYQDRYQLLIKEI